jgi:hypothetical protein
MTEREKLGLRHDTNLESLPAALFASRVLEQKLTRVFTDGWATSAQSLAALAEPKLSIGGPGREQILVEREGLLLHIGLYSGHAYASIAGNDDAKVAEAVSWLRELMPTPDPSSAHEVMVTFWTYGPHGAQPTWRSIAVPAWDEIGDNYPAGTRAHLEKIMRDFTPARGGQLVLWHGLAGTGKTFALRALAWEWRNWCEFHYIVDPEAFFGQHADYMMGVLMQPGHAQIGVLHQRAIVRMMAAGSGDVFWQDSISDEDDEAAEKPWRLLMLEDTGELLQADARAVMGQALSRFLNVVDGLIGQGLRVLVLVTTNEEIRKLHPAVARPGRSAANIEFTALGRDEAGAWLERHGVPERVDSASTLASLYALKEGLDPREVQPAGFAP